jgi:predicted RNase H-like HicB family nuclease
MTNFSIQYWYDAETKQYVAEIPELNISDYWDTLEEARIHLQSALEIYFEEHVSNKETTYA